MTSRFGLNFEELGAAFKRVARMGATAADLNAALGGTPTPARDQHASEMPRWYDDPAPTMVAMEALAVRLAKQIDNAVLAVLAKRGLTLVEALPRLSRQVLGGTERILLDGEPIVEVGPLRTAWSEDGLTVMAGRAVREVSA